MSENNYSLTDVATALGGTGGGMNLTSLIMILLVFTLFGGGGFWGARGGDYGSYASAASQQEILYGQRFQGIDDKLDRGFTSIGNGISSLGYATQGMIKDGNAAVTGAVTAEGRALQSQLAEHNCTVQRNVDALRFDMSNYNAAIAAAIRDDGEKTRALIQQNKIEQLQEKVRSLELGQAMCGVVRYPTESTYNAGGSPFCNCNRGCGCGNV